MYKVKKYYYLFVSISVNIYSISTNKMFFNTYIHSIRDSYNKHNRDPNSLVVDQVPVAQRLDSAI